jgi:hypothetical protein
MTKERRMNRVNVVNATEWLVMLPARASEPPERGLLEWFAGERELLEGGVVALLADSGWWKERWDDYRPVYWMALVAHWRSAAAVDALLAILRWDVVFGGEVLESAVVRVAGGGEGAKTRVVEGIVRILGEGCGGVRRVRLRCVRLLGVLMMGGGMEEGLVGLRRVLGESGGVGMEAARRLASARDLWSWPAICSCVEEEDGRAELWEIMLGRRALLDGIELERSPLVDL